MAQNQNPNQSTSQQVAAIASRAMQDPKSLTPQEIKTLAASVQNQHPNQKTKQKK